MMNYFKIFIGILLTSYSLMFWVIYLNLFNIGYNVFTYLLYMISHFETLLFIPGIFIIYKTLHQK